MGNQRSNLDGPKCGVLRTVGLRVRVSAVHRTLGVRGDRCRTGVAPPATVANPPPPAWRGRLGEGRSTVASWVRHQSCRFVVAQRARVDV